ncbi:hypothetical protein M011DRAFT_460105 [Sporormia fimetaria CBS 119925]|uniref:Uncharacterized protein n=1 Tax=Sporormia fimetaria CBS 119925 TaxID=1340428 RepID=A0A6A6V725_9PLEO|nr:hypothetical protein M011DRAFT_460105 [Sporormia fimetaria CBS 119925]
MNNEHGLTFASDSRPGAITTGSHSSSVPGARQMGLSGDPRLMTDASVRKYNEDIADRNITGSRGGTPSSQSSQDPLDLYGRRLSHVSLKPGVRRSSLVNEYIPESEAGSDVAEIIESAQFYRQRPGKMTARTESEISHLARRSSADSTDDNAPRSSDYGPRVMRPDPKAKLTVAQMIQQMDGVSHEGGAFNLENTEQALQSTHFAPAVTHEYIKPIEHEVHEERIYREIHNHDVYPRIQPVYETEVLPPRHFIPDPNDPDNLIEVSEDQLPEYCKNGSQTRYMTRAREHHPLAENPSFPTPQSRLTQPEIVEEKSYTTADGRERKDSVILHPSTLNDMSSYTGPVREVHFGDCKEGNEECIAASRNHPLRRPRTVAPLTLREFTKGFPKRESSDPLRLGTPDTDHLKRVKSLPVVERKPVMRREAREV